MSNGQPAVENEVTSPGAPAGGGAIARAQKYLRLLAWSGLWLFLLLLFTIAKLPEDRLKAFIQGSISSALSSRGITFSAGESSVSILLGPSYKMKDVTLNLPPPEPPARIDKVVVSPSLLSLLLGRVGAKFAIENGDGELTGSFSAKPSANATGPIQLSFDADDLNVGKIGLLPALAGVKGSFILEGKGDVSGDPNQPATLDGRLRLKLSKIVLDPQQVGGFNLPRIAISDGVVEIDVEKGKAMLRSVRLGKPGNASDDLTASFEGDIQLARQLEASTLNNVKARFGLSEAVKKSFPFIDALLGAGKQADGTYAFNLAGPMYSPSYTPLNK